FITEELWQLISERKNGESISTSSFPKFNSSYLNKDAEIEMEILKQIVTSIRNIRGEMNIPPSKMIKVLMKSEIIPNHSLNYIETRAEEIIR
ncbi:MAG: class I tRNA ligase family protein, partial [Chitinophagales bacterium]|nr:class I tRNA ligase family protein [Chitinophagales bacterium]